MKIIRPIAITSAMLTDSNVPETDYAEWLVGTSYTAGDNCIVIGTTHKIYEALVDVTGGDSPELDVLNSVPKWLEVSADNRWKAFDTKVGSQTSQATSITFEITPGVVVDSIAFLNMDCVTIQIVSTDPVFGEVYNETVDMLSTVISGSSGIYDWYTYFFSTNFWLSAVVKFDLPPYLNTVLTITITNTGDIAKCGGIVIGVQTFLGITKPAPSVGIHDYSIKEQDAFGIWSITERSFAKRMSCDLLINSVSVSDVQNILTSYRATALVWVGAEDHPELIVYGFFKDFDIILQYASYAVCSLEIEGLT